MARGADPAMDDRGRGCSTCAFAARGAVAPVPPATRSGLTQACAVGFGVPVAALVGAALVAQASEWAAVMLIAATAVLMFSSRVRKRIERWLTPAAALLILPSNEVQSR
jgi:hypothetical protein